MENLCYSSIFSSEKNSFFSESNFSVWHDKGFDVCFEHLVFVTPFHAIFALLSSYFAGWYKWKFKRKHVPTIAMVRLFLALIIILAGGFELLAPIWLPVSRSPAEFLSQTTLLLAWICHAVYLIVIGSSVLFIGRGPLLLNLSWYLSFVALVLQLHHQILFNENANSVYQFEAFYFHYLHAIPMYIIFACEGLYCLTLLFSIERVVKISDVNLRDTSVWKGTVQSINNPSENGERSFLLSSEASLVQPSAFRQYGSVSLSTKNVKKKKKELFKPEDTVSMLSRLTFWWVQPIMSKGARGEITSTEDLPHLPQSLTTENLRIRFQKVWNRFYRNATVGQHCNGRPDKQNGTSEEGEKKASSRRGRNEPETVSLSNMRLFWALNRAFGCQYYSLAILKLLVDAFSFVGPILLQYLVAFMEERKDPIWYGYAYAVGMVCGVFINAFLRSHYNFLLNKAGLKFRGSVIVLIFLKALRVNVATLAKFSMGEIANFMSTDADRIRNFCNSFHECWSIPLQILTALILLYLQVGLSFLGGLAIAIVLIPVNYFLAKKIGKLTADMMAFKDSRVKTITEMLFGIRVIKFCAWESVFASKVNNFRTSELKSLMYRKYLDAGCVYFWATTPIIISIVTFTTYSLLGNRLTAANVFTSLSLFSILIAPLNAYPWVISGLVEAWVSFKRVQRFLNLEELDPSNYYKSNPCKDGQSVIEIRNGCFTWKEPSSLKGEESARSSLPFQLLDLTISVQPGQLVGVLGKVGSGKSSLLAALTAEVNKLNGHLYLDSIDRGIAIVTQDVWIQHATLRENVLFGRPFNQMQYDAVLSGCALKPDLEVLPAGDLTEIGENGVTLSGGQKMRVSLARAVYQDKEIYLLDDPFAAVDAHVASHIYDHCLNGLLRNKTRILCTHHLRFLNKADQIIALENGQVRYLGTSAEVLPRVTDLVGSEEKEETETLERDRDGYTTGIVHQAAVVEPQSPTSVEGIGSLVKEEEREVDVVKPHVYWSYFKAIGFFIGSAIFVFLFLMEASKDVTNWWLAYWVSTFRYAESHSNISLFNETPSSSQQHAIQSGDSTLPPVSITTSGSNLYFYIGVYLGLAATNSVFTLFRAFLFAYGGICAAKVLHKKLLKAVLHAPVMFFDTNPIGRIINRFSSDVFTIDDSLPFQLNIFLAQIFSLLGTLTVVCYSLPWIALLLVPLAMIYYKIQKYYRHTSRELKRFSSVTLSPIYAHFTETLTGLQVVRAFGESARFARENEQRLEINQRALYGTYAASYWLSLRLQMIGAFIISSAAFIAVLEHHFGFIDPGLVGLAISYSLSINSLISQVVVSFSETEKEMVSVERAVQYIDTMPAETDDGTAQVSPNWPQRGSIKYRGVVLRYRPGLPPALREVSFSIASGEKIGIVGRTGAGKSSLFQALFRIVDLVSGTVYLDEVDISTVPLQKLRSNIAIIPQDPFLFSGTVRYNVDPSGSHNDAELWSALNRSHLANTVRSLGGLDAELGERGRDLSAGQRQLLCLARALISSCKVICIDEATATVDMETDANIQETLANEFIQNTVLSIAHRIQTVMNCERILVLERGRVCEFDTPQNLLRDPCSLFSSLVQESRQ